MQGLNLQQTPPMTATFYLLAASKTQSVDHLSPELEKGTVHVSNQERGIRA